MGTSITAVVAFEDHAAVSSVNSLLSATGEVEVLEYVEGLSSGKSLLEGRAADLVIVACLAGSTRATALIAEAAEQQPNRPIVVFQLGAATSTNGFMQDVFAAGADDILTLPETPERVRHTLQKAIARRRGATLAKGALPAPLICVLGPKGGTGKTVTATNLAVLLAEDGFSTTLVDLDLHFGDVGLGLRLSPERTIYDLARSGGTLDAEKLDGYLSHHSSGVRVLLAPIRPDEAGAVSAAFIAEVFAVLRAMSDVVIVDTPAGFPAEVITTIDSSTDVCLVSMLDAFSLKDTKLALETLDRMGYPNESIRLVLNRADTHVGISMADVREVLERNPDVMVPSQRDIPRSVTEGAPIATTQRRSAAGKALRSLASLYAGAIAESRGPAAATPEPRSRGALMRRR